MEEYETEYLEHYGVLGMKWGVRRQQRKVSRNTKKALKMQRKIDDQKDQIKEHAVTLRNENARRVKSKAQVANSKNEIRQLGNKISNEDYGLLFRKRKERKAKEQLTSARGEYKKAIDLDLEIEANQTKLRSDIQVAKETIARYEKKQTKYINKADVARGKEVAARLKLDEKLKETKKR